MFLLERPSLSGEGSFLGARKRVVFNLERPRCPCFFFVFFWGGEKWLHVFGIGYLYVFVGLAFSGYYGWCYCSCLGLYGFEAQKRVFVWCLGMFWCCLSCFCFVLAEGVLVCLIERVYL